MQQGQNSMVLCLIRNNGRNYLESLNLTNFLKKVKNDKTKDTSTACSKQIGKLFLLIKSVCFVTFYDIKQALSFQMIKEGVIIMRYFQVSLLGS